MDRVAGAFDAVKRADFLPEPARRWAAADWPIRIGHGQTNSQPRTVAAMLRLLDVRSGQRVLDVGSGSGWTTALLGHLVGRDGSVVGVEIIPELAAWGSANLQRAPLPWTRIEQALSGVLGWPARAPYDRILVSADGGEVPAALLEQLADAGRMVLPAAGVMTLVERADDVFTTSRRGRYRFVPLKR